MDFKYCSNLQKESEKRLCEITSEQCVAIDDKVNPNCPIMKHPGYQSLIASRCPSYNSNLTETMKSIIKTCNDISKLEPTNISERLEKIREDQKEIKEQLIELVKK